MPGPFSRKVNVLQIASVGPEHQKPFVFDSSRRKVFDYAVDDVAPGGWTASDVEVVYTTYWTGGRQQLASATERRLSGDVCTFELITGRFVARFEPDVGQSGTHTGGGRGY